jgi:Sugar kinases, ribokinase family
MSSFDIVSLGELLIDFTPLGVSENDNPIFERNPGGGPANLACAVAKLGGRSAFIGKVGNDFFGIALKQILNSNGVNTDALLLSDSYKTTLAFVQLDSSGDRSFSFYRKNGADTMLRFDEIDLSILDNCKYFFCSSVLMSEGNSRETSFQMMEAARKKNIPVVFDPNLRLNLWESAELAKKIILKALPLADIVKVSEEELMFLTEEPDIEKAAEKLNSEYKYQALLVTLGPKGCYAVTGADSFYVPGFSVKVVDTTAAGDSFTGGFLYKLIQSGKDVLSCSCEELMAIVRFANAVGALITTHKGAISALPDKNAVEKLLSGKIS